jgi:hypothetical protein
MSTSERGPGTMTGAFVKRTSHLSSTWVVPCCQNSISATARRPRHRNDSVAQHPHGERSADGAAAHGALAGKPNKHQLWI